MAYSTLAKIGAKVPAYSGGEAGSDYSFSALTKPTESQVTVWRDEISGVVDAVLDNYGLTSPATNANQVLVFDAFVGDFVAELVNGVYGYGRFGQSAQGETKENYVIVAWREITEMVEGMAGKKSTGAGSRSVTRVDGYSSDKNNVAT